MAPPRVLLCGDVFGRLNQLFKRVSSVSKSAGPFDFLVCVGQFFPDSPERLEEFLDYAEGRSAIPIPTYFIGDYGIGAVKVLSAAARSSENQGFKMDGLRICENLFWLRASGKFTRDGLSVAYLSGRKASDSQQFGRYNQDDVDALRALADESEIVDLFLTNEWPSGITNRTTSDVPQGITESLGTDDTISEVVVEIKPRYHIAGTKGIFYAREPYINVDAVHVTRFLGLASVGNKDKQKFIHGISPIPASTMTGPEICAKPPNTTLSPFTVEQPNDPAKGTAKRICDDVSDSQYWRYDVSHKRQKHGAKDGDKLCFKFVSSGSCARGEACHFSHDMDARGKYTNGVCFDFIYKGRCERGPDCNFKHSLQDDGSFPNKKFGSETANANRSKECWFCLSGPNVESHLIISIGENFYCALAKGPLVSDHVLIIPVEHTPSSFSLSQDIDVELCRFQNSLQMYFKTQGKDVVFFEWVYKRGTHANIQAVPIPSSKASSVPSIFNLAAKKLGFEFASIKGKNHSVDGRKRLRAQCNRNSSIFYVELSDGTMLTHIVTENEKFPAQFGREVMAGLLNEPDRADWRNCKISKEKEIEQADSLKTRFKEFDPNE